MKQILVTGSAGLIGSQAVKHFAAQGHTIVGIDNDMRRYFFGQQASTKLNRKTLEQEFPNYNHEQMDIRDRTNLARLFSEFQFDLIIHTAAQPSHDWAAKEHLTDFTINALGTLELLEQTRAYCPKAVFIFTSTNKVYGDTPNTLPLQEHETRWEIPVGHHFVNGIDETMNIDQSLHSVFGASKVAADILVQEYGKYFGIATGIFRGGCLTGPAHKGAQLHGFLSYLAHCILHEEPYIVCGYKGKQVRDNIHAHDVIIAFEAFAANPRPGEVYNLGGGRMSNISILEAITKFEQLFGKKAKIQILEEPRRGDHMWYISDMTKFQTHFPTWHQQYTIDDIFRDYGQYLTKPKMASATHMTPATKT